MLPEPFDHTALHRGRLESPTQLRWARRWSSRYDIVLANPPFGGSERAEVQQTFPIKTVVLGMILMPSFLIGVRYVLPERASS